MRRSARASRMGRFRAASKYRRAVRYYAEASEWIKPVWPRLIQRPHGFVQTLWIGEQPLITTIAIPAADDLHRADQDTRRQGARFDLQAFILACLTRCRARVDIDESSPL